MIHGIFSYKSMEFISKNNKRQIKNSSVELTEDDPLNKKKSSIPYEVSHNLLNDIKKN
jgi:hypothetical protein